MRLSLAVLPFAVLLVACPTPVTPGAACERASDCAAPLSCHFGRCRAACSANRDCPAGATCVLEDGAGSCTVETDLGCETGVGRTCASGLLCIADHCLQSCGPTAGCATGSVCTPTGAGVSFCAPSDLDAGLAPIDGGTADAPTTDAAQPPAGAIGTACIGGSFVCATEAATGRVYCWGDEAGNALAGAVGGSSTGCSGDHTDVATPLLVADLADVDQLVCGLSWVCAHRRTDGAVLCWGQSYSGATLPGSVDDCTRTPHPIDGVGFVHGALAAGMQLVCRLDTDTNELQCWGGDEGTVMPMMTAPTSASPQRLPAIVPIPTPPAVAGAAPSIFAVDDGMPLAEDSWGGACYVDAGRVYCWGSNYVAQRGADPTTTPFVASATPVDGLPAGQDVTALAHGTGHTCVLVGAGGDLWCWGIGHAGQLAQDPTMLGHACTTPGANTYDCSFRPLHYTAGTFTDIASHGTSAVTCGIGRGGGGLMAGHAYCWGSGEFAVNTRSGTSVSDPRNGHVMRTDGTPLTNVRTLIVAFKNGCAIDEAGALWCWGEDDGMQLGGHGNSGTAVRLTLP